MSATSRPLPILRRGLADSWRSTLGWAVGLTATLALYLPLFPSIGGTDLSQLIDSLPPELVNAFGYSDLASGAGYTQGSFFGQVGFLLLTIAGCAWGAQAIAGAEESGRLELTLAHGVGRTRYALESAAAIAVRMLALVAVSVGVIIALNDPSELGLEPAKVVAAGAALLGLALLSATVALAVGAITGRRGAGIGAGAGIAVAGYLLDVVAGQSPDLEGLRPFSPFAWAYAESPLTEGADGGGLGLLGGGIALAVAIATVALRRRDVTG